MEIIENYLLRLELPFDPPETDPQKIKAQIEKKRGEWAASADNPAFSQYKKYISEIPEMEEALSDPVQRTKIAKEAIKIREEKKADLRNKFELLGSMTELSPKMVGKLKRQYGKFGISETDIKTIFNQVKNKEESQKIDTSKVLDPETAKRLEKMLKDVGKAGNTIYDILGIRSRGSCAEIRDKASLESKKILAKGQKSADDNAWQQLYGFIGVLFKDAAGKSKYDNYVNLTKYPKVNAAVDEAAKANKKNIVPKVKEALIDIANKQYQLSVSDASVYIDNYCQYKGYALQDNKIVCGLCGTENPPGTVNCIKCGKPLVIICPACQAHNNNNAKTCAKCGFDLTKMDEAVKLIRQAHNEYAARHLDEAERLLKQANSFWPNRKDVEDLSKAVSVEREKAGNTVDEINSLIQTKKYYEAKRLIDRAKASGIVISSEIIQEVTSTLDQVEHLLEKMRQSEAEEAFTIAVQIHGIIADSDELNTALKNYPPQASVSVSGQRLGNAESISWRPSNSVGNIKYLLVRKEGSWPNSPQDGVVLYAGTGTGYTDNNIPKNKAFYYAVFAIRLEISSNAARLSESVVIVDQIKDVHAVGGDSIIQLTWSVPDTVTAIHVGMHAGTDRPVNPQEYEEVPCNRTDGLNLTNVSNGVTYWIAVAAVHTIAGKRYESDPVYVSAMPIHPADPLEEFKVSMHDNMFEASWKESEWDVILFWTDRAPEYRIGQVYSIDEIQTRYKRLNLKLKNTREGEFKLDAVGEFYIIPGVISSTNVVLNEPVVVSSVPPVSAVSSDVNNARTELYINFDWPKKVNNVEVFYRTDQYPEGTDDKLSNRITCSRKQYDNDAGIIMRNPPVGMIYAIIYAYVDSPQHRVYSDPVQAAFSNEEMKAITYSFRYKKGGLFSRKSSVEITITGQGSFVFPGFIILTKFKSTPLKKSDGDIIYEHKEVSEVHGSISYSFDASVLRSGSRLKMFFINDKNYRLFRIACSKGAEIK